MILSVWSAELSEEAEKKSSDEENNAGQNGGQNEGQKKGQKEGQNDKHQDQSDKHKNVKGSKENFPKGSEATAGTNSHALQPETAVKDPKEALLMGNEGDESEKPLTKEEQEKKRRQQQLEDYEEECKIKKIEERKEPSKKPAQKHSLFTETDMAADVAESFKQKLQYEAEALKKDNFGLEILHTLGSIYSVKAHILLKSQTVFGSLGGLWWSVKDKESFLKDTSRLCIRRPADHVGQVIIDHFCDLDSSQAKPISR